MKTLSVLLLLGMLCTAPVLAQIGSLDPKFGTDGLVLTDIRQHSADYGQAFIAQPDGKLVMIGYSTRNGNTDFAIARYRQNGTLDSTFNGTGRATTDFGTQDDRAKAVAVQRGMDNAGVRVVVAGYTGNTVEDRQLALVRYKDNGSLDSTFGANGLVMQTFGSDYLDIEATSIAVQSDGRIVVASIAKGWDNYSYMILAGFDRSGMLDKTFGSQGVVVRKGQQFMNYYQPNYTISLLSNNRLVIGGEFFVSTFQGSQLGIEQRLPDGSLDTSFGTDGTRYLPVRFGVQTSQLTVSVITPSGDIIEAGYAIINDSRDFMMCRLHADGSIDSSFGVEGFVITDLGNWEGAYGIALKADGGIVLTGVAESNASPRTDVAVAYYHADGMLDRSFSIDGREVLDLGSTVDEGRGVVVLADGRVIVGGTSNGGPDPDFALMSFLSKANAGVGASLVRGSLLAYPNPCISEMTVRYTLVAGESVSMKLYDPTGKCVQTFFEERYRFAGEHTERLQLDQSLAVGIYILRLNVGGGSTAVKVVRQ